MFGEPETNIRSSDRILSLEVIDGKQAKSSTGLIDTRLFTGDQQLHLKMDPQTTLWYFQYSNSAILPGQLQGRFTSFKPAMKHAEDYFKKRNVRITRVDD